MAATWHRQWRNHRRGGDMLGETRSEKRQQKPYGDVAAENRRHRGTYRESGGK